MTHTIAYLDCQAGISAEVLLAALLNAGLAPDTLRQLLAALPVQGYQLRYEPVHAQGISGSRVTILVEPHSQEGYARADLEALYQASALPPRIRAQALAILQRLAEAEASIGAHNVDGQSAPLLTLSELVLVTGILIAIDALHITTLYASPLPLTSGYSQTAQGPRLALSPVTLEVLRRVKAPWTPLSLAVEGELVTPIGAALLATLAHFESPIIAIERVGYGFAAQCAVLPWPACLRLCIGQAYGLSVAGEGAETDWVAVIETHIDDMSGELLGGLMERLLAVGALDVSYTPMQMKKNRPATLVRVVCHPRDAEQFALLLLRETSTLGVRIQQIQRRKARRSQQQITTPLGPLLVKVKYLGERAISAEPEYEECRRLARTHHLPLADVYRIAHTAIEAAIMGGRKE